MKVEDESRLVKDTWQEEKDHDHAQLKVEEVVRLALEGRRMAEEEDLGIKAEKAMLKSEAEE